MKRVTHFLKHNANSESPSNILFVDTEAHIEEKDGMQFQTFRLGYAIHSHNDSKAEYPLSSIEDFHNLLDRLAYPKTKLYVFAHNMAYDYTILKLDSYISSRNLEISLRAIDSVFMVNCEKHLCRDCKSDSVYKIESVEKTLWCCPDCGVTSKSALTIGVSFLSSTNFYRQSLKELGKMFGLSKMDSPDFKNVSDSRLMEYCKRDTEVLATVILRHIDFVQINDLGSFKPTIAGQAFGAYRHRFMRHNLLVHTFPEILEMARQSYRGGRCETFRMGRFKNIYKLDINSMYPFVMKKGMYPTRPLSTNPITDCSVDDLRDLPFVMADCNIILKEPLIAVKREKLFFPIGKIRQVLMQPEIDAILKNPEIGEIVKVNALVSYSAENIFSDYVDFFYGLRCSSDNEAIKGMCKLFLNSLYGRFGMHDNNPPELVTDEIQIKMYSEIMSLEDTFEVHDLETHSKFVKIGEKIYNIKKTNDGYAAESIPEIASTVTAYARTMLFKLMILAGRENVLYCDTDSLFVNLSGYENLMDANMVNQNELGKLKLEEIGTVGLFGAKDYTFNGKVKLKGVKHDAEKLSENTYRQWQFQTKNIRYRNGTPDGIVVLNPIIKHISRKYDKGIVSGQSVSPLVFSDF